MKRSPWKAVTQLLMKYSTFHGTQMFIISSQESANGSYTQLVSSLRIDTKLLFQSTEIRLLKVYTYLRLELLQHQTAQLTLLCS
jgi:hypothetical protein